MPIIPKEREPYFLLAFLLQLIIFLLSVWKQRPDTIEGFYATTVYIGQETVPLAIFSTATSIVLVEGASMLYESFAKKQRMRGRVEGQAEGIKKARDAVAEVLDRGNLTPEQKAEVLSAFPDVEESDGRKS